MRVSTRLASTLLCATLAVATVSTQAPPKRTKAAPTAAKASQGEWLTDAEHRQYRIEALPRAVGVKISDTQIRTAFGVVATLEREDATSFYIRVYKVDTIETTTEPRPVVDPAIEPPDRARFRFVSFGAGLPTTGQWRENLVIADINADGHADIVAPPARKALGTPVVYLGDGAGAWTRWDARSFPSKRYDYGAIAVGDLEGDGDLDLVLSVHLSGLMALRRDAPDRFDDASSGLEFAAAAGDAVFSSRAVALVDCNGDRRLDIAALSEGPRLAMAQGPARAPVRLGLRTYVQGADGAWTPHDLDAAQASFGQNLVAADVDGDGITDLVAASGILGRNDILYRGDGRCGWTSERIAEVRPRSYVTAVAASDTDGDGRAEIALGYIEFVGDVPMHGVDLLERDAAGAWQRRPIVRREGRTRIEGIAIADLDADKGPEIAVIDNDGTTRIYSVSPRGAVTVERQAITSPDGCSGASVSFGALDADGTPDLAIAYADESSPTCRGNGALAAYKTQRAR